MDWLWKKTWEKFHTDKTPNPGLKTAPITVMPLCHTQLLKQTSKTNVYTLFWEIIHFLSPFLSAAHPTDPALHLLGADKGWACYRKLQKDRCRTEQCEISAVITSLQSQGRQRFLSVLDRHQCECVCVTDLVLVRSLRQQKICRAISAHLHRCVLRWAQHGLLGYK